jgi:hypothetical protein
MARQRSTERCVSYRMLRLCAQGQLIYAIPLILQTKAKAVKKTKVEDVMETSEDEGEASDAVTPKGDTEEDSEPSSEAAIVDDEAQKPGPKSGTSSNAKTSTATKKKVSLNSHDLRVIYTNH